MVDVGRVAGVERNAIRALAASNFACSCSIADGVVDVGADVVGEVVAPNATGGLLYDVPEAHDVARDEALDCATLRIGSSAVTPAIAMACVVTLIACASGMPSVKPISLSTLTLSGAAASAEVTNVDVVRS